MLLTLVLIGLLLLTAYAAYNVPTRWDFPAAPHDADQYKPGTRVRANHLVRVIETRQAVRGDDGYVAVKPAKKVKGIDYDVKTGMTFVTYTDGTTEYRTENRFLLR